MIGKYPKLRIFFIGLLLILWICIGFQTYSLGIVWVKWLPMLIFLISSILFALNKLWSDIISFFVFIYFIASYIINFYTHNNFCCDGTSFLEFIIWQFSIDKFFVLDLFVLFCLTLYLSFTFYKRGRLKGFK